MDISMNNSIAKQRHRIVILYGSQTGTAQDVAENIGAQSRGTHFEASVMELDAYSIQNLIEEDFVLFVCSTTGQGETPDNMKKFWRFIMRKNLPNDSLQKLSYGVLGLGDSSYAKYNFIAKKLDRRIQQLGGKKLVDIGLADDQHEWGADATVDPWVTGMWTSLLEMYPLPTGVLNPLEGSLPPPRFEIYNDDELYLMEKKIKVTDKGSFCRNNPFQAGVKSNVRVTPDNHFQNTVHVVLDISGSDGKLSYKPGDVVMIRPSNTKENVKRFLDTFSHLNPNKTMLITSTDDSSTLPFSMNNPTTLEKLATQYLDFMSVPRRSFFQMLKHFASDELENEKLVEFSTPEGTDERYSYANRPRRNILEVFEDFHKTVKNIPLERLLEIIPMIQPRAFSIASSPTKHVNEIHILVAIVKYKTMLHIPRQGLCSTWLATLNQGSKVPIWIKTGGISFPNASSKDSQPNGTSCIMIGPGTGVAPFRSAIHERVCNEEKGNVLFFGCRNKDADFYFQEEWNSLIQDRCLQLFTAFSRDQDEKIYVQHRIAEHGQLLWDIISKCNGNIYVAGNSKNMPDSVRDAFLKIFKEFGEMTEKESFEFYETMQKNKKYQQETWS
uniref:NADPH-dependent diflavin oxidoreductase 1-like isoform X1 n=1 Tax=Styela clava TaxID=7725 RepID=UPI00193AB58F|nr:NADPH-dependent diflavin oxidoreductase 1-like isoform X1 [Styela clava]